ncbi:hypothetical protein PoB_003922600 [Plakobranchus ocellatus]|uniref:Uncharacterized protein n=1 Tax=Plakobranchus ocellatus TaxID=259542 RepID=A0AAV4B1M6_9GAST|nr:hypothetical protein PoB_003922600 [Plakobranchus ocellatus]
MTFTYNECKGGVDLSDKKAYDYASEQATHHYWIKIFADTLDLALLSAYEIYRLTFPTTTRSKQKFIQSVIYSLLGSKPRLHPTTPVTLTLQIAIPIP